MNKSVKEYMTLLAWMILPFIVTGLLVNLTGNTIENIFNYGYSIKYLINGDLDHEYYLLFGYFYMGFGLVVTLFKRLWDDLPTKNVGGYQPNKAVTSSPPNSNSYANSNSYDWSKSKDWSDAKERDFQDAKERKRLR